MTPSAHSAWSWEGSASCLQECIAEFEAGLLRKSWAENSWPSVIPKCLSPPLSYPHQKSLRQKESYFLFSITLANVCRGLWFNLLGLVKFLKHSLMLYKNYLMKFETKSFENEGMIGNSLLILTYALQRGEAPTQGRWQESYTSREVLFTLTL